MVFEFSSGGVVFRRGKKGIEIALIQDQWGKWTLSKGRIEKGEKPEAAAEREVKEEMGLKNLNLIAKLKPIEYWYKDKWERKGELVKKKVYFFLFETPATAKGRAQKSEIQSVKWWPLEEALKMPGYSDTQPVLSQAAAFLGQLK